MKMQKKRLRKVYNAQILLIIAAIISIVAFFLNFIGVGRTSRDDESFKNALIMLVIGLESSVISSAL